MQFVKDNDTGISYIIPEDPLKTTRPRPVNSQGGQNQKFRAGLSGFINYKNRFVASNRLNDPTISTYDKTEALRKPLPAFTQRSMHRIDKFIYPGKKSPSPDQPIIKKLPLNLFPLDENLQKR